MRWAMAAFACVALLAAPSAAARAAPNGQLAAVVDERLVTVNADGSGLRTLWTPPAGGAISGLAWAPDGNRLAVAYNGRIVVYDLVAGRGAALTDGTNPGWASDGRLGLRRGEVAVVRAPDGSEVQHPLPPGTAELVWAPELARFAVVVPPALLLAGVSLATDITGAPAWSPDGERIAFASPDGLHTVPVDLGPPSAVTPAPVGPPRWSPDGSALVYPAAGELRTVALGGAAPSVVLAASSVTAADWQPCTAGVTASCVSVSPPRCNAAMQSVTTQAGQPVDLPAWPCSDPAGRELTQVLVKAPDHGTLAGRRYTPAPGFTGQDAVGFRVSNGAGESEPVRVTIFVVPRPAPAAVKPATVRAPFLSARVKPRLDRRRRTLAKLSCDQSCSVALRLTARLRSKRTLKGPIVKRSLAAAQIVSVRLRLPSRPRGRVKTVWITGTVRNATGATRSVKLPVAPGR